MLCGRTPAEAVEAIASGIYSSTPAKRVQTGLCGPFADLVIFYKVAEVTFEMDVCSECKGFSYRPAALFLLFT